MAPLETIQPVRETFFNTVKNKRDIPDDKVRRQIPRIIRMYIHKMYSTYISVEILWSASIYYPKYLIGIIYYLNSPRVEISKTVNFCWSRNSAKVEDLAT